MNSRNATLLGTVVIVFSGCLLEPIRTKDVVGNYTATLPDGAMAHLELRSDGKCERVIHLKDGRCYTNSGAWAYAASNRVLSIKGSGFRREVNLEGRVNPDLTSLAPYDRALATKVGRGAFGGIRIPIGEYVVYRKK